MQINDIEPLIKERQYLRTNEEKKKLILPIIKAQITQAAENNIHINSYYKKLNLDPDSITSLEDVPFIPVQMFKKFDLRTCMEDQVIRVLKSSSTTGQTPSRIPIDKTTAFRQSRALISTLSNFLGTKRRPFLVIDTDLVNQADASDLTARGVAIRGISNFAKETVYIMDEVDGDLEVNLDRLREFQNKYRDQEVLAFGFTFIIWSRFINSIEDAGIKLRFKDIKLLHGGGWKRLERQSVSKEVFSSKVGGIFSTESKNILDFYGMTEQTGVVFVDCEYGYKHVPDFAEVIIRDYYTLEENPPGEPGLIEVMSILPNSYPGQALLTEDIGELIGIDDCSCGRKGKYFVFRARMEKVEIRGCGDIFGEAVGS